jgi:hypothetical protein
MMSDNRSLPDRKTRDISWGANCDVCEERMNADRAEAALETMGDDGQLLCGACRDELRLRAEADRYREALEDAAEYLRLAWTWTADTDRHYKLRRAHDRAKSALGIDEERKRG